MVFRFLILSTVASFALPSGKWEIHSFAKYPDVNYPTALSAAANGDVYISSDPNGSLGREKQFGKVLRVRDKNGDGKADEFVDFVPYVTSPRGCHFVGDTLYLIHPPFLSAYVDKDGDGKSDEEKTLVTGLGQGIEGSRGADHTTNGVRMGIDGWLYIAVGDFGMPAAKAADGSEFTLFGGGVVRVRPDGSELEPYALYTRNIYDVAISPYLEMFSRDNTNDGKGWDTRLHHFVQYGNYGYPRLYQNFKDECLTPLADYGGGSGTGGLYLQEPNLPEGFNDTLFTCDWTTGNCYSHPLKPFEATYQVEQNVFEAVPKAIDLDVDGSQRLYLADWRDGGYKYSGDGKAVGSVQQITVKGSLHSSFPDLKKMDDSALVKNLTSDSTVMRLEAQREILRRDHKNVANAIAKIIMDKNAKKYARVAAIFTYKQLLGEAANPGLIKSLDVPEIREFSLRALTDRKKEIANVPLDAVIKYLADPDPHVQRQALISLIRLGKRDAAETILLASTKFPNDLTKLKKGKEHAQDEHYVLPHLAVRALVELGADRECLKALEEPALRATALKALQEMHTEEAVNGLIAITSNTKDEALRCGVMTALCRLFYKEKPWDLKYWWTTRPDDRGPYYDVVAWEATEKIKAAIEQNYNKLSNPSREQMITIIGKNRIDISTLKLDGMDDITRLIAASEVKIPEAQILQAAAQDPKRKWEQRLACYQALSKIKSGAPSNLRLKILATWLDENLSHAEQYITDFINDPLRAKEVTIFTLLGKTESDNGSRIAWRTLLTVFQSPLAKQEFKNDVKKTLDGFPMEVGLFLAIKDMKITGLDAQIEKAIHSDNEKTIHAAEAAKEEVAKAAAQNTGKKIAELTPEEAAKEVLTKSGNAEEGKRLYTAMGCIACHSVDPNAEQKGPFLGTAGSFPKEYLIESVLDPSKVVAQGFQSVLFTMKDGTAKMGFVTADTEGVITMRDITGSTSTIKRADVKEESHPTASMMPPGLASNLTTDELANLIAYLQSMKSGK